MNQRVKIEVQGIVQGVGFRPYVYRLARSLRLTGSIHNSEAGVTIEIQGMPEDVAAFVETLPREAPPLARLLDLSTSKLQCREESEFLILESTRSSGASTLISPDIGTCDDCVQEMLNPANRRSLYPFINCTNCGPRFTITRCVPYDRAQTSMAAFQMCALCQAEYDNPLDRRFHAQPNACWECGPRVQLGDRNGLTLEGDPIDESIRLLRQGLILAIKGLGGFHLAVDALQPAAVEELRRRKHRADKPFAVMVADLDAAKQLCEVTDAGAELLTSPQRPIVLLRKIASHLDALAPDGNELGLFLPYTPIHHLLLRSKSLTALVMTSGNLSEEPIAIDNAEALDRLSGIADFLLMHNREILLRCDDSVMRYNADAPQFVRRSRGYVPSPIVLRESVPSILAVGGELKNAICLSRGRHAFMGQHIGDLESLSAYDFFQESIHHFQQVLEVQPEVIGCDLHPGYMSTQWANAQAGVSIVRVQHHHAHIASCMAENRLTGDVIGVALDGTGYGTDGHIWGGEVLIASLERFTRAAHLAYTPMPGGEKAVHEPWRMAVSNLCATFGESWRDHAPRSLLERVPAKSIDLIEQMLRSDTNSPLTSSCGRLFDAVAALVCERTDVSYEAQAAIALEACSDPRTDLGSYPFHITDDAIMQIQTQPLFQAVTEDLRRGVPAGIISRRFHAGLIDTLADVIFRVARASGFDRVCLSGGTFANGILSAGLKQKIESGGLTVFTHSIVPPGDGGLSLGQLAVAASKSRSQ